ncbi:hypothetical protein IE53DRAFT_154128 [Violaceomyces palustris]|uniref:Uncharacterized protein n=1 Tax=Violaceomyces palustris TaxID=1673888 RepID=A0ACD0P672_9BASI|nr:hypothetical protein IE53DRAFT_154128 [Violaceomyces palustris]
MTSLTTLFIVGKDEYVEFNETMGSKAFLQHIWDESQTPLQANDLAGSKLHNAGARISKTDPPRIEFPTVLRVKGKGNTYKSSGRYISWDELHRLNPLAVKAPPSLEEFRNRGAEVGSGRRLKPGELLSKDDPTAKLKKKMANGKKETYREEDGWIGGSKESIYASTSSPPKGLSKEGTITIGEDEQPGKPGDRKDSDPLESPERVRSGTSLAAPTSSNDKKPPPQTPGKKRGGAGSHSGSGKSLFERLGMNDVSPPVLSPRSVLPGLSDMTPPRSLRRPGARIPPPLPLTSPSTSNKGPLSPGVTRTPLSASHPPPETPLKLNQRGGPETPATPATGPFFGGPPPDNDALTRGLGLGLTPHRPTIPLGPLGSPEVTRSPLPPHPETGPSSRGNATSSGNGAGGNQIEAMLERLRKARTGLGSEASVWAPKHAEHPGSFTKAEQAKVDPKLASALGVGIEQSDGGAAGGAATASPIGLQLSLGGSDHQQQSQDIQARQDAKTRKDLGRDKKEAEAARLKEEKDAANRAWIKGVIPPTPVLGHPASPRTEDDGEQPIAHRLWGDNLPPPPPRSSTVGLLGADESPVQVRPKLKSKMVSRGLWSDGEDENSDVDQVDATDIKPALLDLDHSPHLQRERAPQAQSDPAKVLCWSDVEDTLGNGSLGRNMLGRQGKRNKGERKRGRRLSSNAKEDSISSHSLLEPSLALPASTDSPRLEKSPILTSKSPGLEGRFEGAGSSDERCLELQPSPPLDQLSKGLGPPSPDPSQQHGSSTVQTLSEADQAAAPSEEVKKGAELGGGGMSTMTTFDSLSHFDWAEDEGDGDDILPDLDDWGITVPNSTSSNSITNNTSALATSSGHGGGINGTLAPFKSSLSTSPSKGMRNASDERPNVDALTHNIEQDSDGFRPAGKRGAKRGGKGRLRRGEAGEVQSAPNSDLGIRIAGRAAAAAAAAYHPDGHNDDSSEIGRSTLLDGAKHSMHAPKDKHFPAASLGSGSQEISWRGRTASDSRASSKGATNGRSPSSSSSANANRASLAQRLQGQGQNGHPHVSSKGGRGGGSHPAPSPPRRERPRVAADSGAFARLMGGVAAGAANRASSETGSNNGSAKGRLSPMPTNPKAQVKSG